MPKSSENLLCTFQQVLFSPKGHVEGFLATVASKTIQVRVPPHIGEEVARGKAPGQRLRVRAMADKSPKSKQAAHPVYEFGSFVDKDGADLDAPHPKAGATELKGVVSMIHFAKHGEPNGVVLKSGAFIHLRPHGMQAARLKVGSRVVASGHLRNTVLGTPLLEAAQVNDIEIE